MIVARLQNLFGENELFNEDVAAEMKRNMIKDLEENRKEEYMSEPGKFSLHCFFWVFQHSRNTGCETMY